MDQRLNIREFRRFVGGFAWPTLLLSIATWTIFGFAAHMLQRGKIDPGVMILVATLCSYASFTVFHESAHENIEGTGRGGALTNLLGWISGAMFLAPFTATKRIHLTHHQWTNDPNHDPDHWVAGHSLIRVILSCITIYPWYLYTYLNNIERPRRESRVNMAVLAFYWTACIAACFTTYAKIAIFGFMIPAFLGTGLTALLFDWIPHHPHRDQTPFGSTRNIPSRFLNILMLGQNVHGVHHLNPRIPFYRYQRAYFAALTSANHSSLQSATDNDSKKPLA